MFDFLANLDKSICYDIARGCGGKDPSELSPEEVASVILTTDGRGFNYKKAALANLLNQVKESCDDQRRISQKSP